MSLDDVASPVALRCEWRFEPQTARELIRRVASPRGIAVHRPYDPLFLGGGASIEWNVESFRLSRSRRYVVLQHEHYKTLYDRRRQMPLVSYAIVDYGRRITTPIDESRVFSFDPTVAESEQFGAAAYEDDFYDRGHLTRRRSIAWGDSLDEAVRAQEQSDYYTNVVPQQMRFNRVVWASVEDECRRLVAAANVGSQRAIEVTGAWFDKTRAPIYDPLVAEPSARRRRVPDAYWKCCLVAGESIAVHCFFVPHNAGVWFLESPRASAFAIDVRALNERLGYDVDAHWNLGAPAKEKK